MGTAAAPFIPISQPLTTIPMRDGTQYVLSLRLLARYWGRRDWIALEWFLRALRGQFDSERICDRCGKKVIGWHSMHELIVCEKCIMEFIEEHSI